MTTPPFQPEPPPPGPEGSWNPAQAGGYAVPPGGYGAPAGPPADPAHDPLISPDYNGWFSRAVTIVKAGWRPLAVLQAIGAVAVLILQLPILVIAARATSDFSSEVEDNPQATPDFGPLLGAIGLSLVAAFAVVLVTALVALASMRIGVSVALGLRPDVGAALRGAAGRMFPLIGWQIVAGFIIVAGLCACVLPAIYLYAVFATLPAVVAFERTNVVSRCFQLFHRDLGSAVARIATIIGFTVGASVLGSLINTIIGAITGASVGTFGMSPASDELSTAALVGSTLLTTVISVAIAGAVAVFTSQLTLTTYADLRARVEPLNAGTLAAEIGLQPPNAAATF